MNSISGICIYLKVAKGKWKKDTVWKHLQWRQIVFIIIRNQHKLTLTKAGNFPLLKRIYSIYVMLRNGVQWKRKFRRWALLVIVRCVREFSKNLPNFSSFHFQWRALFFQNGHCSSVAAESTHDSKTVKWFILISARLAENSRLCELPMMTDSFAVWRFFHSKRAPFINCHYHRKISKQIC